MELKGDNMSNKRKQLKKQLNQKQQYQIANTRMKRFFAMIIDWYITSMLASIPITFFLRTNNVLSPEMFELSRYPQSTALCLVAFGILVGIVYYVIIPTYLWKGQTLGKKLCKIQVIQKQGQDVTLKTMALRELIGATFLEGGITIMAAYLRKALPLFGLVSLVNPLQYLAYGLTLASIVYAYFNPLSQSFHDKLANTIVVNK